MENEINVQQVIEYWKGLEKQTIEEGGDLEFAFWEMMIDFLPPEIVTDMEEKWTEVIPFNEDEIRGRELVDLPRLSELMVLTRETGEGGGYYAMWKKI